ncbi:tRNA (adenosine(37)-N6)-dimethylallyltransferase MiaA [Ferruginibacter sp.]|nr:tRNA (adenosine(37)-N6)-dimethylallyltransferase MiaA [Ferruginibacter sp.]
MKKTCIVIAGPTAVGKTSFAIRLAQQLQTQIISADSRQCFRELNIAVAKPSAQELQLVPHYFISSHSIKDEVNAVVFEQYALQKIADLFKTHDTAVIVGGTGLYIKAFCDGIDALPNIDTAVREGVIAGYEVNGLVWLQNEVKKNDPVYFAKGEIKNPQRLMRALEVKLSSGRSITEFQTQQKKQRDFDIVKIGLELPKELLIQNINSRVDAMMQQGLLDEVKELLPFKNLNALQTVGYRELFDYLNGDITLNDAVERIKINTRQYAKRQMTWFKKDTSIKWITGNLPLSALEVNTLLET